MATGSFLKHWDGSGWSMVQDDIHFDSVRTDDPGGFLAGNTMALKDASNILIFDSINGIFWNGTTLDYNAFNYTNQTFNGIPIKNYPGTILDTASFDYTPDLVRLGYNASATPPFFFLVDNKRNYYNSSLLLAASNYPYKFTSTELNQPLDVGRPGFNSDTFIVNSGTALSLDACVAFSPESTTMSVQSTDSHALVQSATALSGYANRKQAATTFTLRINLTSSGDVQTTIINAAPAAAWSTPANVSLALNLFSTVTSATRFPVGPSVDSLITTYTFAKAGTDLFCLIGYNAMAKTSDGTTWYPILLPYNGLSNCMVKHGSTYHIFGNTFRETSTDETTWTSTGNKISFSGNPYYNMRNVYSDGTRIILTSDGEKPIYSLDAGSTWNLPASWAGTTYIYYTNLVLFSGKLVLANNGGAACEFLYSTDNGVNWLLGHTFGFNSVVSNLYQGGSTLYALDHSKLYSSTDGMAWSSSTTSGLTNIIGMGNWDIVATDGSIYLAICKQQHYLLRDTSPTFSSPTRIIFTDSPRTTNDIPSDITYYNGKFIIVTYGGKFFTSTDGSTWT